MIRRGYTLGGEVDTISVCKYCIMYRVAWCLHTYSTIHTFLCETSLNFDKPYISPPQMSHRNLSCTTNLLISSLFLAPNYEIEITDSKIQRRW